MTKKEIAQRIQGILGEFLEKSENPRLNATNADEVSELVDAGLDSLELVQLVFLIEIDFDILFDEDDLMQVASFEDLVELVYKHR